MGGISDRKQEIKRRRHRKKKLGLWKRKLTKASGSEKALLAAKIRLLTPGCETIITSWNLEER